MKGLSAYTVTWDLTKYTVPIKAFDAEGRRHRGKRIHWRLGSPTNAIDRADWGYGPWVDEPDRMEWEYRGLRCLMVRQHYGGNWCGYVHVDRTHPWSVGATKRDISLPGFAKLYVLGGPHESARVHGGVTYAERGKPCPRYERTTGLWVGFDCSHAWDMRPADKPGLFGRELDQRYRCATYVRNEVELLADQATEATS